MTAAADVTRLKAELKAALAQLVDAGQRAARAEGERDGLRQTVAVLQAAADSARLTAENAELKARVAELERQLHELANRPVQVAWNGPSRG